MTTFSALDASEARAFAERWLPAWTGNDPERLVSFYSDDVFYSDPAIPLGVRGREPLLAYFRKLLARNPDWVWTHRGSVPLADGFLNQWHASIPAGSKRVEIDGVCTVQLRSGLIHRNEVYFDRSALMAALAAQGTATGKGPSAQDAERATVAFPQLGACLCGEVAYSLDEDPVTLYACHCTDCQRQTGSSFALSLIVRRDAIQFVRGQPHECSIEMPDGRVKRSHLCGRCSTRLWGPSSVPGLAVVDPGSLDDTSWLRPVAHIWMRSAQPWVPIPEGSLRFDREPQADDWFTLVRAWKKRSSG